MYGVGVLLLYFIFNRLLSYGYYLLTDIFPLENRVQVEFFVSPGIKHEDTVNDNNYLNKNIKDLLIFVQFSAQLATDECSVAGIVTTCIVEEAQKVSTRSDRVNQKRFVRILMKNVETVD